ncbi:MAG: Hpt domain-containing protein, partial [Candidatus Eremiobacteraeota bacterium]|nr:Hpt domain-containing protein [Candidatus Eremiobacteraeota bacterium]
MTIFDATIVEEAFGDDRAALASFLESVRTSLHTHCARVRTAVENGDVEAIRQTAHALRGSSGHVGGARVAKIAEGIEAQAREGKVAERDELTGLDAAFAELDAALE